MTPLCYSASPACVSIPGSSKCEGRREERDTCKVVHYLAVRSFPKSSQLFGHLGYLSDGWNGTSMLRRGERHTFASFLTPLFSQVV